MRCGILGVGFDPVTMDQALARAVGLMDERRAAYVCTPNPEIVMLARRDRQLRQALENADLVLPDGVGILWAARRLGLFMPERVSGFDFLMALLGRMRGSVYILGGRPGVAAQAGRAICDRFPAVRLAGYADGYFTDDTAVSAAIDRARPDLLMVCLGAGRQEKWMASHRGLRVGLMAGLGGSADVLAGRVRRAPAWWRRHGLEWLYRLVCQPQRLPRQLRIPGFVAAVLRQRRQSGRAQ